MVISMLTLVPPILVAILKVMETQTHVYTFIQGSTSVCHMIVVMMMTVMMMMKEMMIIMDTSVQGDHVL